MRSQCIEQFARARNASNRLGWYRHRLSTTSCNDRAASAPPDACNSFLCTGCGWRSLPIETGHATQLLRMRAVSATSGFQVIRAHEEPSNRLWRWSRVQRKVQPLSAVANRLSLTFVCATGPERNCHARELSGAQFFTLRRTRRPRCGVPASLRRRSRSTIPQVRM